MEARTHRWLFTLSCALGLAACVETDPSIDPALDDGESVDEGAPAGDPDGPAIDEPHERDARDGDRGVFEVGTQWIKDDLVVCWEDSAMAAGRSAGRGYAKNAVNATWGRVSRINFVGWKPCSEVASADIRIADTLYTSSSAFGSTSAGTGPSMFLNLTCHVEPAECVDLGPGRGGSSPDELCNGILVEDGEVPPLDECVRAIAVHEFGHALGLRHEHAHGDSTCRYPEDLDAHGHDGEELWSFEPASVMSYCNFTDRLASGDIRSVTTLYPSQVIGYTSADFASSGTVFGPGHFLGADVPAGLRSIVISAGMEARLCSAAGCWTFAGSQRTLPTALAGAVTELTVTPKVSISDLTGFRGTTKRLDAGTYRADLGGLAPVGNDKISSLFLSHNFNARVCNHEGSGSGGAPCTTFGGGPEYDFALHVKLSSTYDNNISFVEITPKVGVYDLAGFRGAGVTYGTGVYRAGSGYWFRHGASLTIPPTLEVYACDKDNPTDAGAVCRLYRNSLTLGSDHAEKLRYLQVRKQFVIATPRF